MTEKEWIEKIKRECVFNIGNFDIKYAIQLKGKPGSNIEFVSISKSFMNVSIIDRTKHRKFYARMKDKNANLEILAEYHMPHTITSKGAKVLWDYYISLYQKYMKTGKM
jgi:hypothetical protein